MPKISKKKEMDARHKADSVEWALKERGVSFVPNDEPGFCARVEEELRRRHHLSDLVVERPPMNFGGEYIFRSASHLGAKPESGAE